MKFFHYRRLPDEFAGDVYIWDVDKTYLRTNFESFRGLLRILIESSIDKHSIPGVKNLLLELRKGGQEELSVSPLYFISASPVGLKKVLEGKFLLDGVQHDGIVLKDYRQLRHKVGKLRVKNNFSYKLMALLSHRLLLPAGAKEWLFGDDYEKDAVVYSLYADILSGKVDDTEITERLQKENLIDTEVSKLLEAVSQLRKKGAPSEVVERIFIYMIKSDDLSQFDSYGERLIPTRNYLQTAAVLYEKGKISKLGFRRVANSFNLKYPKDGWTLQKSIQDLVDRGLLRKEICNQLVGWK